MTDITDLPAATDTALAVDPSHFESRKVQTTDDGSLLIKPTVAALAFSMLFVGLGLTIAALWSASTFTSFEGPDANPLLLIAALFLIAGLATYYSNNEQLLINRSAGAKFIRSWRPAASAEQASSYKLLPPEEIIAVQTVSRLVKRRSNRSKRSRYTEYQVNLCTKDNERHNAFITLKAEKAQELGTQIAQLFDVPLRSV